jgi:hypothetical protein
MAAVVVTLVRPTGWVVALAGFLAGGGLLLAAWPIVVLPTPSGLQNLLAVPVSTLVFGSPSDELVALVGTVAACLGGLLAAGLIAGSCAERRLVLEAADLAAEEGYTMAPAPREGFPGIWRVAIIRLASLVPPLVAAVAIWPTLYDVAYRELILPEDLATPLPIRVIAKLPVPLLVLAVTWLVSDTAAAAGVRRLVLHRRRLAAAWALGWFDVIRRPVRLLGLALLGVIAQVLAFAPALVAAAVGWAMLRGTLELGRDLWLQAVMTATWVAIWLAALALASVGAAFRSSLSTLALVRAAVMPELHVTPKGDDASR